MKPVYLLVVSCLLASSAAQDDRTLSASAASYGAAPRMRVSNALPFKIRAEAAEVRLELTASDEHQHPVSDLTPDQLTIFDNDKPVTSITAFRREFDLPLDIGIAIDTSSSVGTQFRTQQEIAAFFIRRVMRRETDRAFVEAFGNQVLLLQDFTGDTEQVERAIGSAQPQRLTSLYDAIYLACSGRLVDYGTGQVRRVLLLLSDGEDSYSIRGMDAAIEAAQHAGVAIYAISLHPPKEKTPGDRVLRHLADATGGRHLVLWERNQTQAEFAAIEEELRSEYSLAYALPELQRDGRYHAIRIRSSRNLNLRTRSGYVAPSN